MKTWALPILGEVTIEDATKGVPIALFAIYICGYLVLSIHLSRYGIMQESPLRPRILAAGILASVLTLLPIVAGLMSSAIPAKGLVASQIATIRVLAVPFICELLAFPTSSIWISFTRSSTRPHFDNHVTVWLNIFWGAVISLALIAPMFVATFYAKYWKISSLLLLLSSASAILLSRLPYASFSLFLWYIAIASFTLFLRHVYENAKLRGQEKTMEPDGNVSQLSDFDQLRRFHTPGACVIAFMIVVTLFGVFVYKDIPASIGGGSEVSIGVSIKRNTDNPDKSLNQSGAYMLLDESDQGLYLRIPDQDKGVIFIPKDQILEIRFAG